MYGRPLTCSGDAGGGIFATTTPDPTLAAGARRWHARHGAARTCDSEHSMGLVASRRPEEELLERDAIEVKLPREAHNEERRYAEVDAAEGCNADVPYKKTQTRVNYRALHGPMTILSIGAMSPGPVRMADILGTWTAEP